MRFEMAFEGQIKAHFYALFFSKASGAAGSFIILPAAPQVNAVKHT